MIFKFQSVISCNGIYFFFISVNPKFCTSVLNLQSKFWLRGGYPDSYNAMTDEASCLWRENFIRTYIERDIPQFGFQITAMQMLRLLIMCAHNQGQILNASKFGEALGVTHPTIKSHIDILEQTYILRTLRPYFSNTKKTIDKIA